MSALQKRVSKLEGPIEAGEQIDFIIQLIEPGTMHTSALHEERQVEIKEIVALDNIRVDLVEQLRQRLEQFWFAGDPTTENNLMPAIC